MGWTSYHATHYKNGRIDRKAEIDSLWETDANFKVLKSSIVGSTYYAAIEGNDCVFGMVILTRTDIKYYFNFSYKEISEDMGPYYYDCPKGILDLLTPTDDEYANAWRKRCYENIKAKKNPNALANLPVESEIKVIMPCETMLYNKGDEVILTKYKNYRSNRTAWYADKVRFSRNLMRIITDYEVIKRGNENG